MTRIDAGRQGRQPSASCRSVDNGPLPLVAKSSRENTIPTVSNAERVLNRPDVVALFERRIAERLADLSRYEQVRRFALLPRPFAMERDELTPKQSLRRRVIEANYRELIEGMYRRLDGAE